MAPMPETAAQRDRRVSATGLEWVRLNYGVPARRGGRVRYTGGSKPRLGTIVSKRGAHIGIRLDGDKHAGSYHPTWQLEYLEEN